MIKHSSSLARLTLLAAVFPYLLAAVASAQAPDAAAANDSPVTVVDGKRHIDLLKILDLNSDAIVGNWKRDGIAVEVNAPGKKNAQIEFAYAPPVEYDYCVTFDVHQLSNCAWRQVSPDCWIGDHRFVWAIRTDCNAIRLINGKGPGDAANPTNNPLAIEVGKQYVAVIEVRRDHIRATLNGDEAFIYKPATGDFREVRDKTLLRLDKSIGLHAVGAGISVKAADIVEVTGAGTLLRGGGEASAAPPQVAGGVTGTVTGTVAGAATGTVTASVAGRAAITPPHAMSASVRLAADTGDSGHFIDIPAVKWGTKDATAKLPLLSGISATSISLKPFDDTLVATSAGASRITLQTKKTTALGELRLADAGVIELAQGNLTLQWAAGDQSVAWDAIRYASLELRDRSDSDPTVYAFSRPVKLAVTLNQPKPVATGLPGFLTAANMKFSLQPPSNDWQSTNAKDGALTLTQNGLEVHVKRDTTGGILASCTDPDPDHAQRRLDALNRQQAALQAKLADLKKQARAPLKTTPAHTDGIMHYPATVEDRTALNASIKSTGDELDHVSTVAIPKAQADVAAAGARTEAVAQLDGANVVMLLPNGVVAAQITLQTPRK